MADIRVAVVEDDPVQLRLMGEHLREQGINVAGFPTAEDLLRAGEATQWDVVVTDLRLPGRDGLGLLQALREQDPDLQVILVTAYATVETAVEAMKRGAFGYLRKPINLEELTVMVRKASANRRLLTENRVLKSHLALAGSVQGIVGTSSLMREVLSVVHRAAPSSATVLIRGETGTGKELVARALHALSPRASGPFVALNCAALPETLLEAELFGHEKGAFTGAESARVGRFEAAHGGTLFLDEIGEIPPSVQVKLLRFLQDRTIERLGSNTPLSLDVRLVAATHRDLESLTAQGKFREDLYWRLNVVSIRIPPLRERKEDVPLLVEHFLTRYAAIHKKAIKGFTREFLAALYAHDFPGNIRELENIVERGVVLARGDVLTVEDLPPYLNPGAVDPGTTSGKLKDTLAAVERSLIWAALVQEGHVQTKAAARLGISERMLRYKMARHGIKSRPG